MLFGLKYATISTNMQNIKLWVNYEKYPKSNQGHFSLKIGIP